MHAKLIGKLYKSFESFNNLEQIGVIQAIVELANALDYIVAAEDIAKLVDYVDGGLTNVDLIELEALQHMEEEEEERIEEVQKLTDLKCLIAMLKWKTLIN